VSDSIQIRVEIKDDHYEVHSPPGYRFPGGDHMRAVETMVETLEVGDVEFEPCPADCECRKDRPKT
jgi:hypothetical protein